ncbi:MAG: DHHW family protein [Eubacteriales bacterium]
MNIKRKKISAILFLAFLLFGMIGGILLPDKILSYSERRTLAKFPESTLESILDNDYSESLETYLLEQFPGRDVLRMLKTEFDTLVLGKTDSSGYVNLDGHLFQIQTTYDESQVVQAAELFQSIASNYFTKSNVYYSIIPDKNYFVDSLPKYDYENVNIVFREEFSLATEINVYDTLELDDYYYTDLHAKQESLLTLGSRLLTQMSGYDVDLCEEDYQLVLATETFNGGYAANSAYLTTPDILCYLENQMTKEAMVYDYETDTTGSIYTSDKLEGMDSYDIFLGGARALLTIQNPLVDNGKKIIIFRDSFGSSIAPLLLSEYEEITLVDLRYVSVEYAMSLLNSEENQSYTDVLFLYQVQILYNSNSFKKL